MCRVTEVWSPLHVWGSWSVARDSTLQEPHTYKGLGLSPLHVWGSWSVESQSIACVRFLQVWSPSPLHVWGSGSVESQSIACVRFRQVWSPSPLHVWGSWSVGTWLLVRHASIRLCRISTWPIRFDLEQIATKWISTEMHSYHHGMSAGPKRPHISIEEFFIST